MIETRKCLEYYFDSKKYSKIDIMNCIQQEQLNYPGKKVQMQLKLNEWGIYVIKAEFIDEKELKEIEERKKVLKKEQRREEIAEKVIKTKTEKELKQKVIEKQIKKMEKQQKRQLEKLEKAEKKKYGKYESQGTYRPY